MGFRPMASSQKNAAFFWLLLLLLASCSIPSFVASSFVTGSRTTTGTAFISHHRDGGTTRQLRGRTRQRSPWQHNNKSALRRQSAAATAEDHNSAYSDDAPITTGGVAKRGMSVTLASVYFTVMAAKCALPAALSLLTAASTGLTFAPTSPPQQAFPKLFFLSTLAIAAGKLVLGPLIDHLGGVLSLQIALSALALNLMVIANCQSFAVFAASWICVDFVFSSCWAACINAIHQSFSPERWPQQISNLAAASRVGNAVAFTFFASLLRYFGPRTKQAWRPIFAISSLLQILPIVLLTIFGKGESSTGPTAAPSRPVGLAATPPKKPSLTQSLATVRQELTRLDFWLHLISRSALMVYASFLLFVPSLLTHVYGATPAAAAQVGSIYALGCLLSVTVGSRVYAHLSHRTKFGTLAGLLSAATLASALQWGHMIETWTLSAASSAASFFLWGFAFAIPFYLPPSLYALERGGRESSATIADAFDVAGFALLAAFNGYVGGVAQQSIRGAWSSTFAMTTACAVTSLVALSWVSCREQPQPKR